MMDSYWTSEAEIEAYGKNVFPRKESFGELDSYLHVEAEKLSYPLSFLSSDFSGLSDWKIRARERLVQALRFPQHVSYDRSILKGISSHSSCIREEWLLLKTAGGAIPATILKPKSAGPHPVVIALHDMGGMRVYGREKLMPLPVEPSYLTESKESYYGGISVAEMLVQRGFLVIAIDALGFGERVQKWQTGIDDLIGERGNWSKEQAKEATRKIVQIETSAARAAFLVNNTWAGAIAHDDLITLDFVVSRSDVDSARIACMGFSFGAYRANYLAALDDRVNATISVCWHSTLNGILGYDVGGSMGWFTLIPEIHGCLDLPDIPALACPHSFLAISGWRDDLMQTQGAVHAHRKLRQVWTKAGVPQHLGSLFFDAGHCFNSEMQTVAFDWLEQQFARDISTGRGIKSSN